MQQIGTVQEMGIEEQNRANRVIDTLTALGAYGENVAEVAHDARNMVTALELYCDLLQEPGVLAPAFQHYSGELRLVAAASRRLVDKLTTAQPPAEDSDPGSVSQVLDRSTAASAPSPRTWKKLPSEPIANFAQELLANRNLLAALAGPTVALTIDAQSGAVPVNMTSEDLTRILVNIVKNSTEAMSAVGRIHITLWESCGDTENRPWIMLNVEDNGPGLSSTVLDRIFEADPTNKPAARTSSEWPIPHRGLGLAITRSIVDGAGGCIHAANRDPVGACFQIQLPVRAS